MSAALVDFTDFSWRLAPVSPHRLRLEVFCVPGYSERLRKTLDGMKIKARIKGKGTLRVDRHDSVTRYLLAVCDNEDIRTAAALYERLQTGSRSGVPTPPQVRRDQEVVVQKLILMTRPRT
jgi:hypothetical protein